ncbi:MULTISPECIES: NAD(P)/FAD-dependent oxidoreductase [unclassified Thermosipho (in: thermotogales)]|uniref:NAD(P)/FAD-dependent oxidoreductase n=1 Tax=unclassified Thermosipho (in: thermotogales) TaxID=2676525 RepID=UPI000984808A|nr:MULTISPECIES: NAD(P)/FAD-dependent oxidoreductase [unclassified Thermosipho (in: thermotogales)]MBT1248638.1 pyridine nucleotide-disulfide oxidoreductase [Thermosipho sp. 1244]OOC47622.1 pyridine nucleotide-disulfide oxidoreductase [Thermosipho sp. 1223]
MRVGIVGGGPAGISAAVFLKRYGIDCTIFEKKQLGGMLINAWRVENIPIFKPASGKDIVKNMVSFLNLYKVEVIKDEVVIVEENKIITKKDNYFFDEIIIATGTVPNRIKEFENDKVVYEYRDLPKSKNLAIYGAGDVAFDGAIRARLQGKNVVLFSRSKKIKALPRLYNIAKSLKIKMRLGEKIEEVLNFNDFIKIRTKENIYRFDALLLAIGRKIDLSFLRAKNVHLIGDVAHPNYRQASIAVGDGIMVGMKILRRDGC